MNAARHIAPARLRVPAKWRKLIEEEVERLLAILDRIDGDPDLEPDDEDGEHDGSEPDTDGEDQTTEFRGGSVNGADDPAPDYPQSTS